MNEILKKEFDYNVLMDGVRLLAEKYDFLRFSYLTESVMGKGIPLLSIGSGEKFVYYIGTHHGAERITAAVLLKFISEFCGFFEKNTAVFGMNLEYILKTRTIHIIPMLNPDGADISANGAPKDSLWQTRLISMNGGDDFTLWQANANGVDLNHNYDVGFEEYKEIECSLGISGGCATRYSGEHPESEPETSALCNFIRFNPPSALITLHTQGEEIYYGGNKSQRRSKILAKKLADLTGYRLANPTGAAAYGGLTDYCVQKLSIPAFTVECGKGKNPLPKENLAGIYLSLREALFTFPTMI